MRVPESPRQFFSLGVWDTPEAIADFIGRPHSSEFLERVRPLLESVDLYTLELAAHIGDVRIP